MSTSQQTKNQIQLRTSIGWLMIRWNSKGNLSRVRLMSSDKSFSKKKALNSLDRLPEHVASLLERLKLYFEKGEPLGNVPWKWIDTSGWTVFQKEVYEVAASIPHGETRAYAWVANKIGKPKAYRAVGQALRKNPLPILIPCHRVISSQGSLGGFMGQTDPRHSKINMKRELILLEENYRSPLFPFLTTNSLESVVQFASA